MTSINPEISLKISNLLKVTGKLSETNFNQAKKKFDDMEKHH